MVDESDLKDVETRVEPVPKGELSKGSSTNVHPSALEGEEDTELTGLRNLGRQGPSGRPETDQGVGAAHEDTMRRSPSGSAAKSTRPPAGE